MVWGSVLNPSFFVFFFMSLMGTIMVLVSSGLLGMWLSLELAFFGFIPILNGKSVCENEAAVKYFVIQSVGSGVLLVGVLLISSQFFVISGAGLVSHVCELLIFSGFLVKLGIFPMHFWFPSVMGGCSWFSCFWLSFMQKIGPFWGFSGLGVSYVVVFLFLLLSVLTSVIGSLGGLAQVQLRPLLAYSSLGQAGWMALILIVNIELFIYYMMVYGAVLIGLLFGLYYMGSCNIVSVLGWTKNKGLSMWLFSGWYFLSLAGVPPMVGFVLKVGGVLSIVSMYPVFLSVLLGSTMVSLYFYLNVMISSMICVSSCGYLFVGSDGVFGSVHFPLLLLSSMNILGGIPMFLLCGNLIL